MNKIVFYVLLIVALTNSFGNEALMNDIIEFCKDHNFMTLSVHNVEEKIELMAFHKHLSHAELKLKFTKNLENLVTEHSLIFYGPKFVKEPLSLMTYLSQRFIKTTLLVVEEDFWSQFVSFLNEHNFNMNFYVMIYSQHKSTKVFEIIKIKGVPQTILLEKDSSLKADLQGKH